jgi:hypothetical protein
MRLTGQKATTAMSLTLGGGSNKTAKLLVAEPFFLICQAL